MSLQELKTERFGIVQQMRQVLDSDAPGKMAQWRSLNGKQDGLRARIEALESVQSDNEQRNLDREMNTVKNPQRPPIGGQLIHSGERSRSMSSPEYRALDNYLRNGDLAELRTYSPLSADGSPLVPTTLFSEVDILQKYYGGMTKLCRVVTTDAGNPLDWPIMDDTANSGVWLDENEANDGQVNPTFNKKTLNAFLCATGPVLASLAQVQDSSFDLWNELLAPAFLTRLGRTTNLAYTVGDGSTQPITGLIPSLVAAGGRSVLAIGANSNSGNSADTEVNSVGTDDLVALTTAVDAAYRSNPNCGFMASQSTWDRIRQTKDQFGRTLWQTNIADSVPDRVLGYPYITNNDMANIGAGTVSIVFGDFSQFIVRIVKGVVLQRLSELYAASFQYGFQAGLRTDATLLNAKAFSYLQHRLS